MSLATYTQEVPKLGYWHKKPTKSLNTAMGERYDERVHSRPVMVSESEPMSIQPTPGSGTRKRMTKSRSLKQCRPLAWSLPFTEEKLVSTTGTSPSTKMMLSTVIIPSNISTNAAQCRAMREAEAGAGDAAVAKEADETEHLSSTAKWESEVDKERNFVHERIRPHQTK
ncbi:hypothetical protein B2J93_4045 [Marssonina coronariae]|uniref:Uncharacterized protein n=1 Tax=Diplocarpon coronariae TaxID=2795749 RepID=A0A218ZB47_9HELO|nr:hypothetical protein B2J93_4045 [Marssonina coronariae]